VAVNTGDPIDLSSIIASVQGRSLTTPRVKDIYNKWKLYYYYKL